MKTKRKKLIVWAYLIAAGWFLSVVRAHGATLDYTAPGKVHETAYQRPEDLLEKVPFLGNIPHSFLLGDGYTMKLAGTNLRIDHMGRASRSKGVKRSCMVGLSYTTPVAFFTTRIDLPLFSSPTLAMKDWERNTMGDYVVYMSRLPAQKATLQLSITAKF